MTYSEHAAQIRAAHTLDSNGWCRCGIMPKATPAEHAAHIASMTAEAARQHADKIADRIIETEQRGAVTEYWNDTTEGVRALLAAAAFMALTETENAR